MRVEWYNGKERVSSETITLSAKVTTISKPVTKACTYKLAAMPLEADGKDAKVFVVCGLVDYLVQPCGPVSLYNAFDGTNDKSFESHSAWSHDSVSAWGPMGEFITAACK